MRIMKIYENVLHFSSKNWSFLELPCIFKEVNANKKKHLDNLNKTFVDFFAFWKSFFHHKWNENGLFSPESEDTSCLTRFQAN